MLERAPKLLLLRHGESGLKSPGLRRRLDATLTRRLEEGFLREGVEAVVTQAAARHYVEANDLAAAADVVRRTFGVTSFSPAMKIPSDMASLEAGTAEYAAMHWPAGAESFAVRPRRTGSHPYTSQDVGRVVGSAVFKAMQTRGVAVRVALDDPDFAVHVEVRDRDAYLHHEKLAGPGGLPLGSQGRMVVLLDSGDAAVAAYLMMRRGAQVFPFYVPQIDGTRARPEDAPKSDHPAHALHAALRRWGASKNLRTWWVDAGSVAAVTGDPLPEDGVPLARLMRAAAEQVAARSRAQAVVTGETARSPWAHRLPETQGAHEIPVLRPLMGLTRPIIDDFRELLGLARLGGPRAVGARRVFTAGGREDVTSDEKKVHAAEVSGWDPW